MKERPILFSAPMVRALLDGRKTQTRRIVKFPHPPEGWHVNNCPYGQPGDRLWVRESGWERPYRTTKMMREGADTWPRFAYAADDWSDNDRADFKAFGFKPRPSIHMPRWASRILLEITGIRVERLQDISEEDARAEGCEVPAIIYPDEPHSAYSYVEQYRLLWESINGPGSWDANPWVWCISFRRIA